MTDHDLAGSARRRRLVGGALVAAFAVVLIAIVVVRSNGEKVLNENGETLVLVGKDSATDEVGLDGQLTDVGGCLGISADGKGRGGMVVIWPHGTTVKTPDPLRITVAGTTYGIGDTIEIGGGGIGPLEPSSHFYDKVPDGCRTAKVFVASNG
ncbi:hypothetical protein [Aeromicrobium fastidiosum]|uniref:Uncharacterized protein n=1 Tax=Aeromicrobium fastidiosum TaxID=52699 RepID=A0A641AQC8_9ACTN|nr:hypothetical protein [Aeromicrobium fastidiosum]KAA1378455.1 hypothetical protein ESP62_008865 [Aeromicrobium fastidiosum]MBP2392581.1 hypothetical protein [Aeromicrobium fastidiosum]